VASEQSGITGVSVSLEETLADCEAFLRGDYDSIPEDACYMRGGLAATG
jgi:F-type H+-transporting ATPase subunit beta